MEAPSRLKLSGLPTALELWTCAQRHEDTGWTEGPGSSGCVGCQSAHDVHQFLLQPTPSGWFPSHERLLPWPSYWCQRSGVSPNHFPFPSHTQRPVPPFFPLLWRFFLLPLIPISSDNHAYSLRQVIWLVSMCVCVFEYIFTSVCKRACPRMRVHVEARANVSYLS